MEQNYHSVTGYRVVKKQNYKLTCLFLSSARFGILRGADLHGPFTLYTTPSLSYCKQLGLAGFYASYFSL